MRKTFGVFVGVMVAAAALLASTVSARDSEVVDLSSIPAAVRNDPVFQNRLAEALRLAERAEADKGAMKQLETLGEAGWELFPKPAMSGSAWNTTNQWKNKRIENWTVDAGADARLQAAAAAGLVPYRSPAPAFSRNILLTRDFGTPIQTEPNVCANPEDPANVVVATIDYGFPHTSVYASFDSGETWRGPARVPLTSQARHGGDPVLACGRGNQVYHAFMSLALEYFQLGPWPVNVVRSDIAVSTSADGGLSWKEPSVVARNDVKLTTLKVKTAAGEEVELPLLVSSFLDKPWMGIGPRADDPSKDALYATYTEFTDYTVILNVFGLLIPVPLQWTSEIVIWSSTDNGKTWKKVGATGPVTGIAGAEDQLAKLSMREIAFRAVQGSQVDVDEDGTVYLSWYHSGDDGIGQGGQSIFIVKSDDGGKTWTDPALVAEALEVYYQPRSAFFRNGGSTHPQTAVKNGEIYIVFAARTAGKPSDDGDVYFVKGMDRGGKMAFDKAVRLNQDETDRMQFFPAIDADAEGNLYVMWGDTRDDPAGLKYHIYYTQSKDGGETWGFENRGIRELDTRVTDFYSNPNKGFPYGRFIGDYFAIAAGGSAGPYLVWADTRLGEYGGINQKIGFARQEAIPSPEIYLNPSRGTIGEKVTVQAFNFQPEMSVFVKLGGDIVAGGMTNEDGRLEFTTVMPVSASEGAQDVVVYDESGNVATASFYYDFGINDLGSADDGTQGSGGSAAPASVESGGAAFSLGEIVSIALVAFVGLALLAVLLRKKRRSA